LPEGVLEQTAATAGVERPGGTEGASPVEVTVTQVPGGATEATLPVLETWFSRQLRLSRSAERRHCPR
jgi:hypothetical protein